VKDQPRSFEREVRRAQRVEDVRFWTPIASVVVGGVSLIAGTFVSATCTRYGPGENGCIEYGYELLGRGITVAGLVLLVVGLYVIFTPYLGWPFIRRER
jgi:hypothetical protein